jgi:uncharacterized membrane protein YhaH (DUF805 family)
MNLTTLLFSFQGRVIGPNWLVALIYLAVFVCFVLTFIGLGISSAISSTGALISYLLVAIFVIVSLLLAIWSSIAVGIKRLHDRDQSGWWMLVFWEVSTIVSLLQETAAAPSSKFILGIGSLAVTVWVIVELGCLRGTQGPNRFGSDPLEASPQ